MEARAPERNVEIIRGLYGALEQRDGVTPYEIYAPDIVWEIEGDAVGLANVYRGHDGVRQFWRDWLVSFVAVDMELREIADHGDRVLGVVREHNIGRASGVEIDRLHYAIWTLRDGKVIRLQVFYDRADAEYVLAQPALDARGD